MLFYFPALALGALKASSPSEVLRTSIAIALAGLAVFVADRAQLMRTAIRSGSHLTSGMHVGIPVEAMISAPKGDRKVDVFVPDSKEPFTRFLAWDTPDQPSSPPTEQRFAAVLYGELCDGGWAASCRPRSSSFRRDLWQRFLIFHPSFKFQRPRGGRARRDHRHRHTPAADRTPQDGPVDRADDDGMPPTRG